MNWRLLLFLTVFNPISILPSDLHAESAAFGDLKNGRGATAINGSADVVLAREPRLAYDSEKLNITATQQITEVADTRKAIEPGNTVTGLTAPSSAAKAAYADLIKYFPASTQSGNSRFVVNDIVTADGNVCHLIYRFYYPATKLDLRYKIDLADVQLDTVEGVAALPNGDSWAGYTLKTVRGKTFEAEGNVMGDTLRPTNSIKLIALGLVPLAPALSAMRTLARLCGAQ